MRHRIVLLLACAGILAAAAWLLPARTIANHVDHGEQVQGNDRIAALDAHYRQLDDRLTRIESMLAASQPAPTGESSSHAAEESLGASIDRQQAQLEKQQVRYQGLFEAEPRDPDAGKWESALGRAFSDPGVVSVADQPSTRSALCRRRLCMITARFAPGLDGSDWSVRVSLALAEGFSSARTVTRTLSSGESSLTIYAFKKGSDASLLQQGY